MTEDATQQPAGLADTVIAISAYQSDESVLRLLEEVFAGGGREAAAVIVVDSQSDGSLERTIRRRRLPVRYENSATNLGSAGNLTRRLELAANEKARWCYALNHDGTFDRRLVEALLQGGQTDAKAGAVFPQRMLVDRNHTVLRPHAHIFAMPRFRTAAPSVETISEVAWDSSNGALYSLAPVRSGLKPWADLWMGWEDLAYGWLLTANGWKQLYCPRVTFRDDYEYMAVRLFGRPFHIARKPPWYGYYQVRNLLLIIRRTKAGFKGWQFLARRLFREVLFTLMFRTDKSERLRLLGLGLVDGLRGVTGRGRGR